MKPLPKKKRLLLQKSGIREQIRKLREMVFGAQLGSYPDKEPGTVPASTPKQDTRLPKAVTRAAERERDRKCRRKL